MRQIIEKTFCDICGQEIVKAHDSITIPCLEYDAVTYKEIDLCCQCERKLPHIIDGEIQTRPSVSEKGQPEKYNDLDTMDILNFFRNRYYQDGNATEWGIVANALNELLPKLKRPIYSATRICDDKELTGILITDREGNVAIWNPDLVFTDGHHVNYGGDEPVWCDAETVKLKF